MTIDVLVVLIPLLPLLAAGVIGVGHLLGALDGEADENTTAAIATSDIVLSCPWEAESMTIADLLMSQHRWGRTRCRRFLASIPMSETKSIGSMTERQRHALAARLRGETPPLVTAFDGFPTQMDGELSWAARG